MAPSAEDPTARRAAPSRNDLDDAARKGAALLPRGRSASKLTRALALASTAGLLARLSTPAGACGRRDERLRISPRPCVAEAHAQLCSVSKAGATENRASWRQSLHRARNSKASSQDVIHECSASLAHPLRVENVNAGELPPPPAAADAVPAPLPESPRVAGSALAVARRRVLREAPHDPWTANPSRGQRWRSQKLHAEQGGGRRFGQCPCSHGTTRGPHWVPLGQLGEGMLERAKHVLESFELVVTLEEPQARGRRRAGHARGLSL